MQSGILILHILVCIVLIVLILLQSGREGMGVIFGSGGNSSVFGSQGAGGILVKLTAFLAVMFAVTSLGYNILTADKNDTSSILDVQFEETAPVQPAPVSVQDAPAETKTASAIADQNAKTEEKQVSQPVEAQNNESKQNETKPVNETQTDKNAPEKTEK